MSLEVSGIEPDGVVRLAATGQLTARTLPGGDANPIAQLIGDRWASNRAVLSLAELEYMDSTAIGWLISAKKAFDREGGQLVIHSVPTGVQEMFDLLKLGRLVTIVRDEQEALNLVRSESEQGTGTQSGGE